METIKQVLITKKTFRHAVVYVFDKDPSIAVVEATSTYIPFNSFKEIFLYIGELAVQERIKKLVFDKRKLSVFHQPSMEWYFIEWKEEMFVAGLRSHRKILPNDEVFRQSVKIGREKINAKFPNGKFKEMDIRYVDSIEQGIRD